MKRHFLNKTEAHADRKYSSAEIPHDLEDYVTGLQLLYDVPLTYLIGSEAHLPAESLRFFYIDGNWTEALVDGALSIGRVTPDDNARDKIELTNTLVNSRTELYVPRYSRMHENHRAKACIPTEAYKRAAKRDMESGIEHEVTGFVMRSELVRMLKGLEISAYNGQRELVILRFETFPGDIAMGLFDGEITSLVIAEPKTGLNFGLAIGERKLIPKEIAEDHLGEPLREQEIDIADFKNDSGRLDVSGLAAKLGEKLNTDIGSSKLAFELIAVANRTVFEREGS